MLGLERRDVVGPLGRGEGLCQSDLEIRKATAADEPVFLPTRFRCYEVPQAF